MISDPLIIYFKNQIIEAVNNQDIQLSDGVLAYLTHLLTRSVKMGKVIQSKETYLFDLYEQSIYAKTKKEKFEKYKILGDHALIVSGCFSRSIERKSVDLCYYINMGSSAYFRTSQYCNNSSLFEELSNQYKNCVAIFNEVSEGRNDYTEEDIGRLYSIWLSTKSKSIREKLIKLGTVLNHAEG